jgi:hypothetical protein
MCYLNFKNTTSLPNYNKEERRKRKDIIVESLNQLNCLLVKTPSKAPFNQQPKPLFLLDVPLFLADVYIFTFTKAGYSTQTIEVAITRGERTQVNVKLLSENV